LITFDELQTEIEDFSDIALSGTAIWNLVTANAYSNVISNNYAKIFQLSEFEHQL
jgi:hypothetical protein